MVIHENSWDIRKICILVPVSYSTTPSTKLVHKKVIIYQCVVDEFYPLCVPIQQMYYNVDNTTSSSF